MNEKISLMTHEKLVDCWKRNDFPDDFLNALENYLLKKEQLFGEVEIKDIARWLSQVVAAIEIGIALDAAKFQQHHTFWKALLNREWKVDLKRVMVEWKK